MLRLTTARGPERVTLQVEGELVSAWVDLMDNECQRLLATGQMLQIDLECVTYLDSRAVLRLRALKGAGADLVRCPPLIETMLAED
jgi:hypothetical protein